MPGAILLVMAVLAAEGGWLIATWRAARGAEAGLAERNQERHRLATQDPAPTAERAAAIEADLARAAEELREVRNRLWPRAAPASPPPASRTDAFFDLTAFARTMAGKAALAGVGVKDGERFGFSAYAHDGPPARLIPAVDGQRRAAAELLPALIAARPHRIEAVQREDPEPGRAKAARGAADAGDYFAMDPHRSLRTPGVVATTAFRLSFIGDGRALRILLNRLAAFDCPAVVRGVTVEPAGDVSSRRPAAPGRREPLPLVVRPERSRFSVTVEFCELLGQGSARSTADRAAADPAGEDGGWPEPVAQPRGPDWVYDLFSPPAVYYDPRSAALHAAAPAAPASPDQADSQSDLLLLEVRRGPFRLQLIGYAGRAGELRGIFADADSGETVVARAGDHLPGPGITIGSLALAPPNAAADGDTAGRERIATAKVTDAGTGQEIELSTRGPCLAGPPVALFAGRGAAALRREAGAGESFMLDRHTYCVEQIDLDPPQVLVACAPAGGAGPPIRRTIRPSSRPQEPPGPALSAANQGDAHVGNTP